MEGEGGIETNGGPPFRFVGPHNIHAFVRNRPVSLVVAYSSATSDLEDLCIPTDISLLPKHYSSSIEAIWSPGFWARVFDHRHLGRCCQWSPILELPEAEEASLLNISPSALGNDVKLVSKLSKLLLSRPNSLGLRPAAMKLIQKNVSSSSLALSSIINAVTTRLRLYHCVSGYVADAGVPRARY